MTAYEKAILQLEDCAAKRDALRAELAICIEALERIGHGKYSSYTDGSQMVETEEYYASHPSEIAKEALEKVKGK